MKEKIGKRLKHNHRQNSVLLRGTGKKSAKVAAKVLMPSQGFLV